VAPHAVFEHYLSRPIAVNQVLSNALRKYAETIFSDFSLNFDDLILEIGSSNGAFLNFFKEKGIRVFG